MNKKKTLSRPGSETPADKEARERSLYNTISFYGRLVRSQFPGQTPRYPVVKRQPE